MPQTFPFFGHLFESGGEFYYYEVATQEIIALDSAMAAVLPHFDQIQSGQVPASLKNGSHWDKVPEAIRNIEEASNSDNLFSRHRPVLVPATRSDASSPAPYDINLQHLILTLTENCNLRCRYCLHVASLDWVRSHGNNAMTRETALQATRYFMERCCTDEIPAISFYGGEALLQLEILEAVVKEVRHHPNGKEAHLVIDTNGVLLDEAVFKLVVENKMYLQVSVDGPRRYHDQQRPDARGAGTYDRIITALDRLLELDSTAHERLSFICTVAPPANLMELDEFFGNLPLFAGHGIDSQPNLRINLANLNGQDWPATAEEFADLNAQLGRLREYYFQEVSAGRRGQLGPVVKGLVEPGLFRLHHRSKAVISETYTPGGNCKPGIRKLHVTAVGRLQPCERTGDLLEIGMVQKGIEIGAVEHLQNDFFNAVHENCTDCWALRLCNVCYAGFSEFTGGQTGAMLPESVCRSVRNQVEKEMKLLVRILELPPEYRGYLDNVVIG